MSHTQQVERPDSISSQDPHQQTGKKTKSRKPASERYNVKADEDRIDDTNSYADTAFRQQRLKAWQYVDR
jgi:hypothetical protein